MEPDKSIHSPYFFTHELGYKMVLQLYPNGHGKGKGTHISVFIRICEGRNDDDLPWPFHADVTLEALDLTGSRAHQRQEIPAGVLHHCHWKRPNHNPNLGIGPPKFVSHANLKMQDSRFLVNDTLYIRVN